MAKQPFKVEDGVGIPLIWRHFGECSGQAEKWDARRLAIGLFINVTRERAGWPGLSGSLDSMIGRGVDPGTVVQMAADALDLALDAVARLGVLPEEAQLETLAAMAKPGWQVYFLQGEHGGNIKIGTSRQVHWRIAEFQVGCPMRLVLLATQRGDRRLESALHRRFAAHRKGGEWFEPCEALLDYIEGLR